MIPRDSEFSYSMAVWTVAISIPENILNQVHRGGKGWGQPENDLEVSALSNQGVNNLGLLFLGEKNLGLKIIPNQSFRTGVKPTVSKRYVPGSSSWPSHLINPSLQFAVKNGNLGSSIHQRGGKCERMYWHNPLHPPPLRICDFRLSSPPPPQIFCFGLLKLGFLLPSESQSLWERMIYFNGNYCLLFFWRLWMSLTLCSPTVSDRGSAWWSLRTPPLTIIARKYWGIICMYSNSLYISEGNWKYKTVENTQLHFPESEIPWRGTELHVLTSFALGCCKCFSEIHNAL